MDKLLIITPPLLTNSLSRYLLWQIPQLKEKYEVLLVEYSTPKGDSLFRRILILSNTFISLSNPFDLGNVFRSFEPDIVYFPEFSETFCDSKILNKVYHSLRTCRIIESTHLSRKIQKIFLPDKFVFLSPYSQQLYSQLNVDSSIVKYSVLKKERPSREFGLLNLGLDVRRIHILHVGEFEPNKNIQEIMRLAVWLPNMHFHFVGNLLDPYIDYWTPLLERLPHNCFLHGEEDPFRWLSGCDILLFPAERQLDPFVLKEASACEIKIVMRDSPAYLSFYQEGPNLRFWQNSDLLNAQIINDLSLKNDVGNSCCFSFANSFHKEKKPVSIIYRFINGPSVELQGDSNIPFKVEFVNKTSDQVELTEESCGNKIIKGAKSYYQDWQIKVEQDNNVLLNYHLDLTNMPVYISMESNGLGDNLAWIPYVEEFRRRHKCKMTCLTAFKELFQKAYNDITFITQDEMANDIFAHYRVGCHPPEDKLALPVDWNKVSLQEIAKYQLGLTDLGEIRPKVFFDETKDNHTNMGNFVCIGTKSTMACKEWQNTNGWNLLVKWLNNQGLKVVNLSLNGHQINGTDNVAPDESLQSIMSYLKHCKFFIGLSSGLSWLAWAMHKKVVIISGFAIPIPEFSEAIHVGPLPNKCQGCYQRSFLDIFDFKWCPDGHYFACTRSISFESVREKVKSLL